MILSRMYSKLGIICSFLYVPFLKYGIYLLLDSFLIGKSCVASDYLRHCRNLPLYNESLSFSSESLTLGMSLNAGMIFQHYGIVDIHKTPWV